MKKERKSFNGSYCPPVTPVTVNLTVKEQGRSFLSHRDLKAALEQNKLKSWWHKNQTTRSRTQLWHQNYRLRFWLRTVGKKKPFWAPKQRKNLEPKKISKLGAILRWPWELNANRQSTSKLRKHLHQLDKTWRKLRKQKNTKTLQVVQTNGNYFRRRLKNNAHGRTCLLLVCAQEVIEVDSVSGVGKRAKHTCRECVWVCSVSLCEVITACESTSLRAQNFCCLSNYKWKEFLSVCLSFNYLDNHLLNGHCSNIVNCTQKWNIPEDVPRHVHSFSSVQRPELAGTRSHRWVFKKKILFTQKRKKDLTLVQCPLGSG